jgi:amino acid transporter
MQDQVPTSAAKEISVERQMLKRSLTLLPLFGIIYFTISGGTFGIEPVFTAGAGMALLLICIVPFVYSVPNIFMVRELQSMMPVEGGYYHWTKQGLNPFVGFMTGWMNWVMSWVDVSIYPVLGATYLAFFIPALNNGAGGIPAWVLQWLVAVVIIWLISLLQMRGVRLAGLTSIWLGVILMIPILIMTVLGFWNWGHGSGYQMTFLPEGTGTTTAFSLGLWVVMWNYMGWELPTSAGDEIVKPKRTYPLAMLLVLIASIATYALPTVAALYGGAGEENKVMLWGVEESTNGAGIGPDLEAAGMTPAQMEAAGVDPSSAEGWWLPDIAQAVADKTAGGQGSGLGSFLGKFMTIGAILSMIGLFIGNSVSATRIPFALSEDGMMPKPLVRVHRKWGTPWIAIVICGVIFSIFSLNAFSSLVVIDVLLNSLTLLLEFFALWRLRMRRPDIPRSKVPGGWIGLTIITILPAAIIILAIYSQIHDEGLWAIYGALITIAVGAVLYVAMRRWVKPGVPDIDPYVLEEEGAGEPIAAPAAE